MTACMRYCLILVLFLGLTAEASESSCRLGGLAFRFEYASGDHYDVHFSDKAITWVGVTGSDLGRSETDSYTCRVVERSVYFISWRERDLTHVTLALNLNSNRVLSSGSAGENSWFNEGLVRALSK